MFQKKIQEFPSVTIKRKANHCTGIYLDNRCIDYKKLIPSMFYTNIERFAGKRGRFNQMKKCLQNLAQ